MAAASSLCDPPFEDHYKALFQKSLRNGQYSNIQKVEVIEECELPLVDISSLRTGTEEDRLTCIEAIAKAASKWGVFMLVNHGINPNLLREMRREQMNLFKLPFHKKASSRLLNDSYRWGTPSATSLDQLSWSEAFHVPLAKISQEECYFGEFIYLREVMERLAGAMSELGHLLAGALAENLGHTGITFTESCSKSTCFLRLNRYPPCPFSLETFGLTPHTDSDFLTILQQDRVGGLQFMKDSKWVAVKPDPDALIVNIGDLFQAWSNNIYRSVKHKVIANRDMERYSIAFFLCPSYDSTIGSCSEPSVYKGFTFGEFRRQVQEDVKRTGQKVGLSRFLL